MRVTAKVRGAANAQSVFDFMNGREVRWTEPKNARCAHTITFEYPSAEMAEKVIKDVFHPQMSKVVKVQA